MVEYTIDDIRGPTVAREMAQLKSFVLEKFNGAIADAEAAAAAAAQAVLDSLDARVGALEGDMTTVQGAILTLDGAVVKLAGTQTITGTKNVPLEATGTASDQIASSQKVKNELDNYAPMVRTTGNQNIDGAKKFLISADAVISNSTSNDNSDGTIGRYKVIMKLPLNVSYGPRSHILVGVTTRQRSRPFDLLSIYMATSSPQDLTMVLRANTTENYTYVFSYDANYAYLSILTYGTLSDGIQTLTLGSTYPIVNSFPMTTATDVYDSPPGTELRRLTP